MKTANNTTKEGTCDTCNGKGCSECDFRGYFPFQSIYAGRPDESYLGEPLVDEMLSISFENIAIATDFRTL